MNNIIWYYVIAGFVSTAALIVASLNYRRKSGLLLRGQYTTTTNLDCHDCFVSSVIIENLKDRAVTIFNIYLQMGYGNYLLIEDFKEKPLVLKAYENYQQTYGPIQFYGSNLQKIHIDHLLFDLKVPKRLVLSTGDGKYVVQSFLRKWSPLSEVYTHPGTLYIQPIRNQYKNNYIGSNVVYILDITDLNGKENVLLIKRTDIGSREFEVFNFTEDALSSGEKLQSFLDKKLSDGDLQARAIKVFDCRELTKRLSNFYLDDVFKPMSNKKFQHYILALRLKLNRKRWFVRLRSIFTSKLKKPIKLNR